MHKKYANISLFLEERIIFKWRLNAINEIEICKTYKYTLYTSNMLSEQFQKQALSSEVSSKSI